MRSSIAQNTRIVSLVIIMLSLLFPAIAQKKRKDKKDETKVAEQAPATPDKKEEPKNEKEKKEQILPYEKVITSKAKTDDGLFKVHKVEDKYYFEIPDTLLGREILSVTRIAKTATG